MYIKNLQAHATSILNDVQDESMDTMKMSTSSLDTNKGQFYPSSNVGNSKFA